MRMLPQRACAGPSSGTSGGPSRSRCARACRAAPTSPPPRGVPLVMAISEGTRSSVLDVGVPRRRSSSCRTCCAPTKSDSPSRVARACAPSSGSRREAFVVGCISRFHPKKRNDVVVERGARARGPRVHLILAGDGETEAQLRELAAPLGERAHFIATPGSEVPDVLSAFDVSVFCPSPTEGAPRAVILGMLASRPVPVDRRRGRRGHDHAGDRRDRHRRRTTRRRCACCWRATSRTRQRAGARGRRGARLRRAHVRCAGRRRADRAACSTRRSHRGARASARLMASRRRASPRRMSENSPGAC